MTDRLGRTRAAPVIACAFDQAEARDPDHQRRWVLLVDGARHQIESIQAEADRRGVTVHILREKERLYLQADQHEYQLGA